MNKATPVFFQKEQKLAQKLDHQLPEEQKEKKQPKQNTKQNKTKRTNFHNFDAYCLKWHFSLRD